MLNFGDAMYEADLHARRPGETVKVHPVPPSRWEWGFSFATIYRGAMARFGDWLINVGCELEVRYLTEGRAAPCAG